MSKWKKLKDTFDHRPTRPTRRPRRKVKHWTPKGDCKVTGNGERNQPNFITKIPMKTNRHKEIENWEFAFNFIFEIPLKKYDQKKSSARNEIAFKFTWKSSQIDRTSNKNCKRIPFQFWSGFILKGNSLYFR